MSEVWGQRYRVFVTVQIAVITATLAAGTLSYLIPQATQRDFTFGLIRFFDVGRESNFPTYISAANLLVASGLCYLIYKAASLQGERPPRYWLLLGGIFLYLSADEAAMIHEHFDKFRVFFPDSDLVPPRHDWLFAGVLLASGLGLVLLPFLFLLSRKLAISFFLAGSVYAFGVIGMEFVGSMMLNHGVSPEDFAYQLRRLLEEAFEMFGIVLFNCAAAGELARRAANFKLIVSSANTPDSK